MALDNGVVTVYGPVRLGSPAVIVHGGAGGWRGVSSFAEVARAVEDAASAGLRVAPVSALEAVKAAIVVLEDSGVLNAGIGSVLTFDGRVAMDAGVMDDSGHAGGAAIVSYPKNPILLAGWIAENLYHVILGGPDADRLAERIGLERHPGPSKRALEVWRKLRARLEREGEGPEWARKLLEIYGDTVGAVVVSSGHIAAGTSTGGVALKHPGRIGDSPIPGAGFYVEPGVGGCAATGVGETIILGRPCIKAVELLREGLPVEEAARISVQIHTKRFGPDNLGLILLDTHGEAAAAMNTAAMPVGFAGGELVARGLVLSRSGGKVAEK